MLVTMNDLSLGTQRKRICAEVTWVCGTCGEEKVGLFYFQAADQAKNDHGCPCGGRFGIPESRSRGDKREVKHFPFTSAHIDGLGTPITVENLRHMRQIEQKYGVLISSNRDGEARDLPIQRRGGFDHRDPRAAHL